MIIIKNKNIPLISYLSAKKHKISHFCYQKDSFFHIKQTPTMLFKCIKMSFSSDIEIETKLKKLLKKTLYHKSLFKKVKKLLPKASYFMREKYSTRFILNNKFKKSFISSEKNTMFNNTSSIPLEFKTELLKFESKLKFSLVKKIPRINSSLLANQLKQYIKYLIFKFQKEGIKDIKNITVKKVFDKIKPDVFFDKILLQVFSITIMKSLFHFNNHQMKTHSNEKLEIELYSYKLHYRISERVLLHLSYLVLEESKSLHVKMKEIYDQGSLLVAKKSNSINENFFQTVPCQLYDLFFSSLEIKKKSRFNPQQKCSVTYIYMLPKDLTKFIGTSVFPTIVPSDITFEDVPSYLFTKKNKLKVGLFSKIQISKKTKEALTTAQIKPFKINEKIFEIFEYLDSLEADCFKNTTLDSFVPKNLLRQLLIEIKDLELRIKPENIQQVKNFLHEKFKNPIKSCDLPKEIHLSTRLSLKEVDEINELRLKRNLLRKYGNLRALHNTRIKIAKIYRGYSIFFTETFDYRLRMYPYSSSLINRTSGIYKYLLEDYTKKSLKKEGLYCLLEAFYKNFPKKHKKLVGLKKTNIQKLVNWNRRNLRIGIEEILKCKSPIYALSLFYELKQIVKQKLKTRILIEIDQRNSSSVFSAIILGDIRLASLCNLYSKTENDLGSFIMFKSKNWYKNKISKNSLEILTTTRKIHKKLLMCFYFGQTYFGRIQDLKTYFCNFGDINVLAKTYNHFLDDIFPTLTTKINLLKSILSYCLEKNNVGVTLKTLDQSRIFWSFASIAKKTESSSYKSENSAKRISYRQKVFHADKLDSKKLCSSFLACYIHSLDAAVMRLIILEIKKNCNYVIVHLHDSLQFHPSYYHSILKSITNVYTSGFLTNIIHKTLINILKPSLKKKDLAHFEFLVQKFTSQRNKIQIKKKFLKIQAMFNL